MLYPQKYFQFVLPRIVEGLESSRGQLRAFSCLILLTITLRFIQAEDVFNGPYFTRFISTESGVYERDVKRKSPSYRIKPRLNIILQLMVYLIQGLELPGNEIRKNVISTLSEVASSDGPVSTQDQASTLTSAMLSIALSRDAPVVYILCCSTDF